MFSEIIRKCTPALIKKKVHNYLTQNYVNNNSPQLVNYNINVQDIGRAKGKVVLVTGGTGAIGSAICLRLAIEGATVGVCGRNKEKISHVIDKIKSCYAEADLIPIDLDVTDECNIKSAIDQFYKHNGKLDILINNAGGGARSHSTPLREQETTIIDVVLNTNLRGALLCAKYASEFMVSQKGGKIISMSSVMGMNGKENWSEYSSSKSGILGMTKSLALELGEYNITVNAVSPGMVQQIPFDRAILKRYSHTNALKRFGYTDEVASLVAYCKMKLII